MEQTALLPFRRKACCGFFRLKNPTASAGFEPVMLGTRGQHAKHRTPKPLGAGVSGEIWPYSLVVDNFICVSTNWFIILPNFTMHGHMNIKVCFDVWQKYVSRFWRWLCLIQVGTKWFILIRFHNLEEGSGMFLPILETDLQYTAWKRPSFGLLDLLTVFYFWLPTTQMTSWSLCNEIKLSLLQHPP
jgi:hypothetical protein